MKLQMCVDGEPSSTPPIIVETLSQRERLKQSLRIFFVLLAAALGSVFIPVLHFVLVPVFLLAAIGAPLMKYKEVGYIDLSAQKCPVCQGQLSEKQLPIKANSTARRVVCSDCRRQISFEMLH